MPVGSTFYLGNYPMKSSRGFTLIELLIVIAIIGILMALLFPAVQGAIDAARRAQAKNDVTQIATAINAYVTEYGRLPVTQDSGTMDFKSNNALATLMGVTNDNPRGLVFLEVNYVRDGSHKSGYATNSGANQDKFIDPWGAPYKIALDTGYSNSVTINYSNQNVTVRKTVAVCSGGGWTDQTNASKTARRYVNSWE